MRPLCPGMEQNDDVVTFVMWNGDLQSVGIDDESKLASLETDFVLEELVHVRLYAT